MPRSSPTQEECLRILAKYLTEVDPAVPVSVRSLKRDWHRWEKAGPVQIRYNEAAHHIFWYDNGVVKLEEFGD